MSPQEVLDLCRDLDLEIRAEDDTLIVSPAEKLPATLRDQLRSQKEAILTLLVPSSFDNPRTKIRTLEKAFQLNSPQPEEQWIVIKWHEHRHVEPEIEAVKRRLLAAAVAQFRATGDDTGFCQILHIGLRNRCVVCRELGGDGQGAQEI